MSRLRAETMPAVTVPPRLNGLPIAITHSPSRSLSESPNFTALSGLSRLHPQHARVGLLVAADDFGLEPRAVVEDDGDLVGVGDDVVVGDDDAGRIDDEAGAERVDAARRAVRRLALAALAAAVLEELLEEFLERRAGRQLRRRLPAALPPPLPPGALRRVCEVEMLTTASITCSATSAMLSGPRASAGAESAGSASTAPQPRRKPGGERQRASDGECRKRAMAVDIS